MSKAADAHDRFDVASDAPVSWARNFKDRFGDISMLALLNLPVLALIAFPLLMRAVRDGGAGVLSGALMYLSSMTVPIFVAGLVLLVPVLLGARRRLFAAMAAAVFTLLQLLVVADVRMFSLFKFHLNGLVLNVLLTEGAGDTTHVGGKTILSLVAAGAGLLALEVLILRISSSAGRAARFLRRRAGVLILLCVLIVLADKVVYVEADLRGRDATIGTTRYYPFYIRITINKLAARLGWVPRTRAHGDLRGSGGRTLAYPRRPLAFSPAAERPSVLLVIVESLRADALTSEIMPCLTAFGSDCIRFDNHFSNGNGTRFGVFSLLYGLNGNLWQAFLQARQPPAWVESLRARGYRLAAFSSARLTFPEFRKTAFVSMADGVVDDYPQATMIERDAAAVAGVRKFTESGDTNQPFFVCLFLNSPHLPYIYPPSFEHFRPVTDPDINYMRDLSPEQSVMLKNRYWNSLRYTDHLLGKLLESLRAHDSLKHTIIIMTGDHGQEFNETGFCGHNSAFNQYQLRTPLLIHVEGETPRRVSALTAHVDVMPSILRRLGCTNDFADYSHGRDLFGKTSRSWVFARDWGAGAVVTPQTSYEIPYGLGGAAELRSCVDYRRIDDPAALKAARAALTDIALETAAFLR